MATGRHSANQYTPDPYDDVPDEDLDEYLEVAQRGRHAQPVTQPMPTTNQAPTYVPAQPGYSGGGRHASNGSGGNKRKGGKKRSGKKGGVWSVVFYVALVIFIAALAVLGVIAYSYWQGEQTYEEVADVAAVAIPDDLSGTSLADLTIDWDALEEINSDIVGWIYIPGTVVNYPIVHTTDNDYYLDHDFYGEEGWVARFGTIFLSAENRADLTDDNNLIYGHHMADGSMFAIIANMTSQSVFDEYRTIYILTPNGNYMLRTFALVDVDADDADVIVQDFSSDEERIAYLEDIISRSLVTASDIADLEDMTQIYMFCTCDELTTDGRYLLYAYVVESTVDDDSASVTVIDPDDVTAVADASDETVGTSDETDEDETTEE